MKSNLLNMQLQYFAADDGANAGNQSGTNDAANDQTSNGSQAEEQNEAGADGDASDADQQEQGNNETTYTQAQVESMINERLAREKEANKKAQAQAAKLAKMNADQKKDYELEQAQKAADEAKAKLAKYEMADTARKMLADEGISVTGEDLDLITTADAETTQANVKQFVDFANRLKEATRKEYLAGNTPRDNGKATTTVTQDEFDAMTYDQRAKIQTENPQLFRKLTGGI